MDFYEALEVMKRGGEVQHAGKTYALRHRGIHDVSDRDAPIRVTFTPEAWNSQAADVAPEVIAPEAIDEALREEEHE